MKKPLFILIFLLFGFITYGQVGIGTTQPDPSSQLDIRSQSKGLLIPRMSTAQLSGILSPAQGLLVFVTDGNSGFYYNTSTNSTPNWVALLGSGNGNGWSLQGNLISGNEFIGTTNAMDFIIKANNSSYIIVNSNGNVGVNDNGSSPDPSAVLHADSHTKGFLCPVMTTAARNAMSNPAKAL